jgi:hypothetical protein
MILFLYHVRTTERCSSSFTSQFCSHSLRPVQYTRLYPKVSGLAAWSENCKWYVQLSVGAVDRYFVSQSSEFCRHNPLCCFSTSVHCFKRILRYRLSPETLGYILVCHSRRGHQLRCRHRCPFLVLYGFSFSH